MAQFLQVITGDSEWTPGNITGRRIVMKRLIYFIILLYLSSYGVWAAVQKEAAGSASRGRYLAGEGVHW